MRKTIRYFLLGFIIVFFGYMLYSFYEVPLEIDTELKKHTIYFLQVARSHDLEFNHPDVIKTLIYGDPTGICLSSESIGCCRMINIGGYVIAAQIVIHSRYKKYTRAILFHELGHCLLNQGHIGYPFDLMYPYISDYMEENIDEILHRTFKRIKIEQGS